MKRIVMNALAYKADCSGIGVMMRELFSRCAATTVRACQIVLPRDIDDFSTNDPSILAHIPYTSQQNLQRILYQLFCMGRHFCKDSLLLTTDAKVPLLLPKSCTVLPLITDLAVYRMPETYQTSRVLLWKLQYHWLRRRTRDYLTISEFSKSEITAIFHVPPERIRVVPCACSERFHPVTEEETLRALREKYDLPERFLLFVGNTNPRKNLRRLLTAFDMVKDKGYPHELVIAGGQGWKFDRESELSALRNKESVRFIGFVPDEDMPTLYSAAEAFLFPTLYEGFGIPVLESQRCGTPVVTSNCTSLPEVGGEGAIYVDPLDVEDMAKGIETLLSDKKLAAALAEKGYRNAERFSWDRSAALLNEIIEEKGF